MLIFTYLASCLIYLVLIVLIVLKKPKSISTMYFLILLIGILGWTFTLYLYLFIDLGYWLLFIGRLNYSMGVLISFGITAFFYEFPKPKLIFSRFSKISFTIYSLSLFFISLFTPLIDKSETITTYGPVVTLGDHYYLYAVHLGISIFLPIVFGLKKISFLSGLDKLRFQYSFWIFIPGYAIGYIIATILPIFGVVEHFKYMFLVFVPGIISSFYSIYKYRFFNFSNVSLNFFRKTVLCLIFLLTIYFLFNILTYFFQNINFQFFGLISSIIGLILFIEIEKIFPKFISEDFRIFYNTITELKSEIYSIDTYDKLINILENGFVIKLNIKSVNLFLTSNKEVKTSIPFYLKDKFTKNLEGYKKDSLFLQEIDFMKISPEIKELLKIKMSNLNAYVCIPLFSTDNLIGFLTLGSKEKESPYTKEEIDGLLEFRNHLEIIFMNILLTSHLKEENDLMKNIIFQKTQKLREQIKKVRDLVKQQSDFIAVIAHEFRTPLSIAIFQLEDIKELCNDKSEGLENIESIGLALTSLKDLTQKLFDSQQYDLYKVKFTPSNINLISFLEGIYKEFLPFMNEKSLKFLFKSSIQKSTKCNIDELQMKQVFNNLISNAIKFTPNYGEIVLQSKEIGEYVFIYIIDTGEGIPGPEKKRVFEKFRTGKNIGKLGLGLGLYICKKIIGLHRGEILVNDTPNGGTIFSIKLKKVQS